MFGCVLDGPQPWYTFHSLIRHECSQMWSSCCQHSCNKKNSQQQTKLSAAMKRIRRLRAGSSKDSQSVFVSRILWTYWKSITPSFQKIPQTGELLSFYLFYSRFAPVIVRYKRWSCEPTWGGGWTDSFQGAELCARCLHVRQETERLSGAFFNHVFTVGSHQLLQPWPKLPSLHTEKYRWWDRIFCMRHLQKKSRWRRRWWRALKIY